MRFSIITSDDRRNLSFIPLILRKLNLMADVQDKLLAEVARQTTINAGISTLIAGLKTQLQAAIDSQDLTKVQTALDTLTANDDQMAQAVTDNTPAAGDTGTGDGGTGTTGTGDGTTGTGDGSTT